MPKFLTFISGSTSNKILTCLMLDDEKITCEDIFTFYEKYCPGEISYKVFKVIFHIIETDSYNKKKNEPKTYTVFENYKVIENGTLNELKKFIKIKNSEYYEYMLEYFHKHISHFNPNEDFLGAITFFRNIISRTYVLLFPKAEECEDIKQFNDFMYKSFIGKDLFKIES